MNLEKDRYDDVRHERDAGLLVIPGKSASRLIPAEEYSSFRDIVSHRVSVELYNRFFVLADSHVEFLHFNFENDLFNKQKITY